MRSDNRLGRYCTYHDDTILHCKVSDDAGLFHSQASRDPIAMPSPGTSGKGIDVDVAVARCC